MDADSHRSVVDDGEGKRAGETKQSDYTARGASKETRQKRHWFPGMQHLDSLDEAGIRVIKVLLVAFSRASKTAGGRIPPVKDQCL